MSRTKKSGAARSGGSKRSTTKKRSKGRKRTKREPVLGERQWRDAIGLMLIALGVYLGGLVWFGWEGGELGSRVVQGTSLLVGSATLAFPLIAFSIGFLIVARSELIDPGPFRAGLYILIPGILLSFGSDRFGLGDGTAPHNGLTPSAVVDHGGFLGGVMYSITYNLFGDAGTTVVCVLAMVLGGVFLTGSSVQAITRWWAVRIGRAAVTAGQTSVQVAQKMGEAGAEKLAAARAHMDGVVRADFDPSAVFPDIFGDVPGAFTHAVSGAQQGVDGIDGADDIVVEVEEKKRAGRKRKGSKAPVVDDDQLALLEAVVMDTDLPEKPDERVPAEATEVIADDALKAKVAESSYVLPSPKLLKVAAKPKKKAFEGDEAIKRLLVETFGHFGIAAQVVGVVPGPRVSRYELSIAKGTKMSKVEGLRKDLAYALATTEIRILAPIPGKSAVGIEVENKKSVIVTLGDIWQPRPENASPLFAWFGKDISGDVVGEDLARMPHLLVAGTTGAGKSGCMNSMLSSIVLGASPDEVKMLLIDPKKVELSTYEGLPHLLTPVVTNMKKAANALANVVDRMERRYASMELAGVRTLPDYNRVRVTRGFDPEPYVLVVIDELADLVMQSRSDVENAVIRIAQKGRAAGFHLVVATQRPSVDVITGMIKSNIPSRIAFAVSSQTDSRVILDENGAEALLGQGDMLFKPVWARQPLRVQGAWISEPEVRRICDAAREQRAPEFDQNLLDEPEVTESDAGDGKGSAGPKLDDRLAEAIQIVAELGTCSASLLQRRMRVGYTRGGSMVDQMEQLGLVGRSEGPRPRDVLFTIDELPRVLESLESGKAPA